jgi:hypothetical protein
LPPLKELIQRIQFMRDFIKAKPELWNEDVGG